MLPLQSLRAWAWVLRGSVLLFSIGRVPLSALSWYSACTSVSEGVFLMYLWREMYSTSTYSSAILFSAWMLILSFELSWKLSSFWRDYRTPTSAGLGLLLMNLYKQNPSLSTGRSLPIPFLSCQALGAARPLQGILKERTSGQMVPAAARVLPQYSPIRISWPQAASLLVG